MTWLLTAGRFLIGNWKLLGMIALVGSVLTYVLHCEHVKRDRDQIIAKLQVQAEEQEKRNKEQVARDRKAKEAADESAKKQMATLQRTIKRLRDERQRAPSVPAAPASSSRPDLACFDRAELSRAVGNLEAGVEGLVAEGAAAALELDAAREWARGRP